MTSTFIRSPLIGGLMLGAACSLGCASAVPRELNDARDAYRAASQGPAARYSPAQLHSAQQSLKLAEKTFEEEGDTSATRDRSYVALRKAQLATTRANIDQGRAQLEAMARETDQQRSADLAGAQTQLAQEEERRKAAEAAAKRAADELARLATVKQEARGMVIILSGSVLFASDKAELLPAAQRRLSDVAKALNEGNPGAQIVVEGHTDAKGSQDHNLELSARRAEAVRTYLVAQGVDQTRIRSQGPGLLPTRRQQQERRGTCQQSARRDRRGALAWAARFDAAYWHLTREGDGLPGHADLERLFDHGFLVARLRAPLTSEPRRGPPNPRSGSSRPFPL